jgi:hypothetical protein
MSPGGGTGRKKVDNAAVFLIGIRVYFREERAWLDRSLLADPLEGYCNR